MVEVQTSSLTGSHLLTAVKFSAYRLLLHLCCFAKTTPASPASSRKCRSAHCSKEICAAPVVGPLICAITNLKAFSKILLCVFDLLWPADSRGLLSFQVAPPSRQSGYCSAPLSEGVPPPTQVLLPFYLHYCKAVMGT